MAASGWSLAVNYEQGQADNVNTKPALQGFHCANGVSSVAEISRYVWPSIIGYPESCQFIICAQPVSVYTDAFCCVMPSGPVPFGYGYTLCNYQDWQVELLENRQVSRQTGLDKYVHKYACMCAYIMYISMEIYMYYTHTHTHIHTHTYIHTYIHTHIHTYIHTYIHRGGGLSLYRFLGTGL